MRPIATGAAEGLGSLFGTPDAGTSNVGQVTILIQLLNQLVVLVVGSVLQALPAIKQTSAGLLHLFWRSRTNFSFRYTEMFKAQNERDSSKCNSKCWASCTFNNTGGLIDTSPVALDRLD